jgi:hypothetical protein
VAVSDFGISANPSPITISAPGQGGSSTISVTPQGGFTGTVALNVVQAGCPAGATCTLSPTSVNVTSASAVTTTLTITTTAASSQLPPTVRTVPPGFHLPIGLLALVAGLLLLAFVLSPPAKRWRPVALLFASTVMVAALWIACGGSGGGGGTTPPPAAPVVSLSPTSLTFTSQNTGTTSAAQAVTLTNTGTASLTISSIGLAGTNMGDFGETTTCGSSLAAGSNCSINVKFSPTASGTRTASVSIVDNATGSPQSITLTGTGAAAATPTPPGTYPLQVNAVSGGITHSVNVNVVVQ